MSQSTALPASVSRSLRRNHLSAVAISVVFNAALLALLLSFTRFSDAPPPEEIVITMIDPVVEDRPIDDPPDPEEVEPADPDLDETVEFNLEDMISDMVREPMPEVAPVESSNVSPVVMAGLTMGATSVDFGSLDGGEAKSVRFMGGSGTGNRFAFVIDYSKSMSPRQLAVMKYELTKALRAMRGQGMATLLFFSGPVWRPDQDAKAAEDLWTGSNNGGWRLKRDAEGPDPRWLIPHADNLAALERMIHQTPTTYGTDWYPPLKTVLEMRPKPDVVFFMTDGACPESSELKTIEFVESLPPGEVEIHTVALGVAEEKVTALKRISDLTRGTFRRYGNEELKQVAENLPEPPDRFDDGDLVYLDDLEAMTHGKKSTAANPSTPRRDDTVTFQIR